MHDNNSTKTRKKGKNTTIQADQGKNRQKAQIIGIVNEIGDVNTDYAYI